MKTLQEYTKTELECLLINNNYTNIANQLHLKPNTVIKKLKKLKINPNLYYVHRNNEAKTFDSTFFRNIDSERKAYWFGFLLADGCLQVKPPKYRLSVGLSIRDYNHLCKLAVDLQYKNKLMFYKGNCSLEVSSFLMCKDLLKNKFRPRKSQDMEWTTVPDNLMNHMIRGYFDGDGCISKRKNRNSGTITICGSKNFLEGLSKYLSLSKYQIYYKIGIYALGTYNLANLEFFYHYMYHNANVYLERKYNKFKEILGV